MMADEDENQTTKLNRSISNQSVLHKVSIYLLRNATKSDNFKIRAYFNTDLYLNFERGESFSEKHVAQPYIYILNLDITESVYNYLYITKDNSSHQVYEYKLGLAKKFYGMNATYRDHQDEKPRSVIATIHDRETFVFDAYFKDHLMGGPPGSSVSFWNQLTLYTFYILHHSLYELFDKLTEQFRRHNLMYQREMLAEEFDEFFKSFIEYFDYALGPTTDVTISDKFFFCLVGLIPLTKQNFQVKSKWLLKMVRIMLKEFEEHHEAILEKVQKKEWVQFRDGLTLLMVAECLTESKTTILLLQKIPDEAKRKDVANSLLALFGVFQLPIRALNWVDLFSICDPEIISIKHLGLARSIESYVQILRKVGGNNQKNFDFNEEVIQHFNRMIDENRLPIDLNSIMYALNLSNSVRTKSTDPEDFTENLIIRMIEESTKLRKETLRYLSELKINQSQLDSMSYIVENLSKSVIFDLVRKDELLKRLISNTTLQKKFPFFQQWFLQFFTFNEKPNDENKRIFNVVLLHWKSFFVAEFDTAIRILQTTDKFLDALKFDEYRTLLVHQMIDLSFRLGRIEYILSGAVGHLTNPLFVEAFKRRFSEIYFQLPTENLKQFSNQENPINKLLRVYKAQKVPSSLILSLLELSVAKFLFTENEVLRDSFTKPNENSAIFIILFEKCFENSLGRKKIIEVLEKIWNNWQKYGLKSQEIVVWNQLQPREKEIVEKIWNLISEKSDGKPKIVVIIDEHNKTMKEKLLIKEEITRCLETSCKFASDKNNYMKILFQMEQQLRNESVQSVKIPQEVLDLIPFARQLNPFGELHAWKRFLRQFEQKTAAVHFEPTVSDNILDNDFLLERRPSENSENSRSSMISITSRGSVLDLATIEISDKRTCLEILGDQIKILEKFKERWEKLCLDWEIVLIGDIIELFPDLKHVGHDLKILSSLREMPTITELVKILDFWKRRKQIKSVCNGWKILFEKMSIEIEQAKLDKLKTITEMNEKTAGFRCTLLYDDYKKDFSGGNNEEFLSFISEHEQSIDLIRFLETLGLDDADNFLQAVNDWDETLINTKTVLDLVQLKQFFVEFNSSFEQIRNEKTSNDFENVFQAFQLASKKKDLKGILNAFRTCSESLTAIQRVYLELTDKESAKQGRIADIMENSKFYFIENSNKFDIELENFSMHFADLSELRDRARLMQYSIKNQLENIHSSQQRNPEELESFVLFVELTDKILKNLTSLNLASYPDIDKLIHQQILFSCVGGKFSELEKFSLELDDLLYDWETHLCKMYEKHLDLTFFCYQQIWTIEDFLYDTQKQHSTNHPAFHYLNFISIGLNSIELENLPKRGSSAKERLEKLGEILSAARTKNQTVEQENPAEKKIFFIQRSEQGVLRSIVSMFKKFKTPMNAANLFFCNEKTSWTEIRAFTYRCFFSQQVHQLIRPEFLSASIQDQMTNLLRDFTQREADRRFRLVLITNVSDLNLQLINGLRTLNIVQNVREGDLLEQDEFEKIVGNIIERTSVRVTSDINGLGKTSWIKEKIRQNGHEYVKFSISGDVKMDELIERLRNYSEMFFATESSLHIDLSIVEQPNKLNEFLYSLLLFRAVRLGQNAVCIRKDLKIYIELDASPSARRFFDKIDFLRYVQIEHFTEINWQNFKNFSPTKLKLVLNYLESINDQSILNRDIQEGELRNFDDNRRIVELLQNIVFQQGKSRYFSWIRLSIFISVYYGLFRGFSRCGFFLVHSFPDGRSRILRKDLLDILLKCSDQFTSLCVDDVRDNQRAIDDENAQQYFSESIVGWEKTQPFTLIFNKDDTPIFVYKKPSDVPQSVRDAFLRHHQLLTGKKDTSAEKFFPDYQGFDHKNFFLKLATLTNKFVNKAICKKCYRAFEYAKVECNVCPNEKLLRPDVSNSQKTVLFQEYIAGLIQEEYVLTPDNYIKMLLIYLRVQCNLPVLIMGETGCGKTALIQFLSSKILDDELEIFRIHAGINNEMILDRMKVIQTRAEDCAKENKRLWLFFDEFNTTSSIGLIKEMVCERTLLGEKLLDNIVILGACNPQRRKPISTSIEINVGIKKNLDDIVQSQKNGGFSLLYTVVPIPESMLEYIWDYGFLDEKTEAAYIRTMLNACKDLKLEDDWFNLTVQMISESQKYFRRTEDVSSVSLRDVARFRRLYNWFLQSLIDREGENKYKEKPTILIRRSTLATLLLCYYFRLNSTPKRNEYAEVIEQYLRPFVDKFEKTPNLLRRLLEGEQEKLVSMMSLPPGTAKNQALMGNIFVLLVCIVNRIPVILCGKPGCSKTSAVQIVISHLRGQKSSVPYFQKLPELMLVSYQGSQNCTSESIVKVFHRADKYINPDKATNLLPVIVFDEIGLAELSPHNPLKVLHSKLEVETCQYGFVGLSNWRLDASKMNRALYLACPDPDIEDLNLTAKAIAEVAAPVDDQVIPIDSGTLPALAASYYHLYQYLKTRETEQKYGNYFGLRDFYSLIKGVVNDLNKSKTIEEQYASIRRQMLINFDGILDGSQTMWESFCENIYRENLINEYLPSTFKELVDQRMETRRGRYLMLIAENESVIDYVERYLLVQHPSISFRTMIGSRFSGDLISGTTYTEEYNYRVLMDVILYAETNVTLIMRRMGHLYDNLYDLFNQNFMVSGQKKYCRIALGALYHPRCLVNDDFYCIVFVLKDDVEKCDPPFLNRFEKHLINIQSLIDPKHLNISQTIIRELNELIPRNLNKYFPVIQNLFVDFSPDYVCNLVLDAFDELSLSIEDEMNTKTVIDYCRRKLIRTSSFDLPVVLSLRGEDERFWIDEYYSFHSNISFKSIQNDDLELENPSDRIIYTFTQIFEQIQFLPDKVEEIKLSTFKSELELTSKIKQHYQNNDRRRLLLIRLDFHQENEHLLVLKNILKNSKVENCRRAVWLIIHLQRNLLNKTTNNVLFNGWSTLMLNDLNENKLISRQDLLNPSYRDLILNRENLIDENIFDEVVDRCFTKFRYVVDQNEKRKKINQRRNEIISYLTKNVSLRKIVKDELLKLIKTVEFEQFSDWRNDLLTDGVIIGSCRSLNDAFQSLLTNFIEKFLFILFVKMEKNGLIDSFIFLSKQTEEKTILEEIWFEALRNSLDSLDKSQLNESIVEINLFFDLKLPLATIEYETIRSIRSFVEQAKKQSNNEIELIDLTFKQFFDRSQYKTKIETIFSNEKLFRFYLHDQLILAQNELKFDEISTNFLEDLLTKNPQRTERFQIKNLIVDFKEFSLIVRIFRSAFKLTNEKEFVEKIFSKQFEIIPKRSDALEFENNENFSKLILSDEQFFVVPALSKFSPTQMQQNFVDPFVEVTLTNLVEFLLSPLILNRTENLEIFITIFSRIGENIVELTNFTLIDLEKLRSFIRLLVSINGLLPQRKSIEVFRKSCSKLKFQGNFSTSNSIEEFIRDLKKLIVEQEENLDENFLSSNLAKLESEFLKNWLEVQPDKYFEIVKILTNSENQIWQYSAKILSLIDLKLQLVPMIVAFNGSIPFVDEEIGDDIREIIDEYQIFDDFISNLDERKTIFQHLLANRLHTQLVLTIKNGKTHLEFLQENFQQFQEILRQIQNSTRQFGLFWLSRIVWLKCFSQFYAVCLFNDEKDKIFEEIDDLFVRNEFKICSTLKIFIVKQICHIEKIDVDQLRDLMKDRTVNWIKPFVAFPVGQMARHARQEFFLPTGLFENREEFQRVDKILTNSTELEQIRSLIKQCRGNQQTSYSFLLWFVHFYGRFATKNEKISTQNIFAQYFTDQLADELVDCFQPIGAKLLFGLATNFLNSQFFHLSPLLSKQEIYQRLVALNLIVVLVSFRAVDRPTFFSSFLFDKNLEMPKNYFDFYQNSICFPGLTHDDPLIKQMIDVRTTVEQRLNQNQIHQGGKFIFQCSADCLWFFFFVNCGVPVDKSFCPICKKEIGAASYGVLIKRDPPQIQRTIPEAFQFIDQKIDEFQRKTIFGYKNFSLPTEIDVDEKPIHLAKSISHKFLRLMTHTVLLFLKENSFLDKFQCPTENFLQDYFKRDFSLICQQLGELDQGHIVFYRIFENFLDRKHNFDGFLDENRKRIDFEKNLEENIFIKIFNSFKNDLGEIRRIYDEIVNEDKKQIRLEDFLNETKENEEIYPNLSFFNVTNIEIVDPLEEFLNRFNTIGNVEKKFPTSFFILKRLEIFENLKFFFPIVEFSNYLIEKFNLRIKRNDAAEKSIDFFFKHGNDRENFRRIYDSFVESWFNLNLNEIQFGCQRTKFRREISKEEFPSKTKLAVFLLNESKDESSLMLAACLKTLAEYQNEIVRFFHFQLLNESNEQIKSIPVQSIRPEHIFKVDRLLIIEKIIKFALTVDFRLGQSRNFIFDFEEIELTLTNSISSLPLIDSENLRFLNYQFELYGENSSLINDVRKQIQQEKLRINERSKLKSLISTMQNDDLIHYLGSLDYVFTYLRNSDKQNDQSSMTIQNFVENSIQSRVCLNDHVLHRQSFATIELRFIIDLYELVEECAFDQVLRQYVKPKLAEDSFLDEQRKYFAERFRQMTFANPKIADSLKKIELWIGILKRLMVRVLSNVNVSLDVPIQLYLERTDLWPGEIIERDLQGFQVDDEILLEHTFILLQALENELQQKKNENKKPTSTTTLNNSTDRTSQVSQTPAWRQAMTTLGPRVLKAPTGRIRLEQ